jgi:hypothetical protein
MGTHRPGGEKEHVIVLTENCILIPLHPIGFLLAGGMGR